MEIEAFVLRELTYKIIDNQNINLDIYLPDSGMSVKTPVVVYIHGGSWVTGDKNTIKGKYRPSVVNALIKNGYAVVSIDYRLTNDKVYFPAPIEDCKDAVRWIRKNAETYNFDTDNIGVWGSSAGAHLSMLLAYTDESYFPGISGLREYSSKVRYVINNFAPVDLNKIFRPDLSKFTLRLLKSFFKEKYAERQARMITFLGTEISEDKEKTIQAFSLYSPITYVCENSVPTLIFHGDKDKMVNVKQAKLLDKRLEEAGVEHELIIYPGAVHGFDDLEQRYIEDITARTLEFVRKHTVIK